MSTQKRRNKILNLINDSESSLRTSELAEQFDVTTETIRRDLIYLDEQHLIEKIHGGARPISEFVESSLGFRLKESVSAKKEIAKSALKQLDNCSVIFIDAGSTTNEFASLLSKCLEEREILNQLAIVTNSFPVANALMENADTLFFIGGEVSQITQATSGIWALNELYSIKIDIAFLGTSGFFSHNGPCTKLGSDATFKSQVIKNSSKSIVLADHTKFSTNAIMQYASWEEIDMIITDSGVNSNDLKALRKNVKIIVTDVVDEI